MKQKSKMFIVLMLIMIMVMGQSSLIFASSSAKKSKPKLSKTKIVMESGTTKKLTIKKVQKKSKISWKSSNSKVVKVTRNGKLVAKNPGKSVIKVTIKQNSKKVILKCKVTVKKKQEISTVNLPKKNNLFDEAAKNVTSINYWINDREFKVADSKKMSNVINYLSSLEIEQNEPVLKVGGRFVRFVTSEGVIQLTLFEKDFVYNGKFYVIKDTNINITQEITKLLQA